MAAGAAASSASTAFPCGVAGLPTSRAQSHKALWSRGGPAECSFRQGRSVCPTKNLFLARSRLRSLGRHPILLTKTSLLSLKRRLSVRCLDKPSGNLLKDATDYPQPSHTDVLLLSSEGRTEMTGQQQRSDVSQIGAWRFQNRFLMFARLGSVINDVAESFFKSEIRRRLFVTSVLILLSRVGYFIPLPGFDRRLIPEDYLTFASGSTDELGDFTSELKLSLFQLGISPQIAASIVMQVLCHIVPSLVKLRKEGLDAHDKIKGYIWWLSLGFAMLEAVIVACYSLPYSIYASSYRFRHVMVTSFLLVLGAMAMTSICDTISESGFGGSARR